MAKTQWKATFNVWLFSLIKIPLVFWLRPRVMELTDTNSVILMPFKRRTKNHLNSMYFGAISIGAELAPGLVALRLIRKNPNKISFLFKDFYAEFLKRAEADVYFNFDEGHLITQAIQSALQSKERQNVTLNVTATIPSQSTTDVIARFKLTLSLKSR